MSRNESVRRHPAGKQQKTPRPVREVAPLTTSEIVMLLVAMFTTLATITLVVRVLWQVIV